MYYITDNKKIFAKTLKHPPKKTHLNTLYVRIVITRPKSDIPHPIQVMISKDNGFEPR